MNAWFMHHPENFPPTDCINPLYISFHVQERLADRMLTPKVIEHLKKYAPIGCRDTATRDLLQNRGIDSYFSGCLTLTLGKNYLSKERDNTVYFVDPYYELGGNYYGQSIYRALFCSFFFLLRHWRKVNAIKDFKFEITSHMKKLPYWLSKRLMCASFYHDYSKVFTDEILFSAKYLIHRIPVAQFASEDERMEYARNMVRTYAKAKLVVTSRIHCALPCLGIETPVIFVNSEAMMKGKVRTAGRFGGNIELLHVMKWTQNGIVAVSEDLKKYLARGMKISSDIELKNKDDYKVLRDKMVNTVLSFLNRESN